MNLSYTLLDPTGNMTILVHTPVPVPDRPEIANHLMKTEPSAEQVGFVSMDADSVTLRMAGGEFCGNASLCAAALFMRNLGLTKARVTVHASGAPLPVMVTMTELGDNAWQGTVVMPAPLSIGKERVPAPQSGTKPFAAPQSGTGRMGASEDLLLPVIRFPGIAHVILEQDFSADAGSLSTAFIDPETAAALAPIWCRHLDADALGMMFLNLTEGTLKPLVYVPGAQTLCWENACASGTSAAGAFAASKAGQPVDLRLKQPGGSLRIQTDADGTLLLTGAARIVHDKHIRLPDPV